MSFIEITHKLGSAPSGVFFGEIRYYGCYFTTNSFPVEYIQVINPTSVVKHDKSCSEGVHVESRMNMEDSYPCFFALSDQEEAVVTINVAHVMLKEM